MYIHVCKYLSLDDLTPYFKQLKTISLFIIYIMLNTMQLSHRILAGIRLLNSILLDNTGSWLTDDGAMVVRLR